MESVVYAPVGVLQPFRYSFVCSLPLLPVWCAQHILQLCFHTPSAIYSYVHRPTTHAMSLDNTPCFFFPAVPPPGLCSRVQLPPTVICPEAEDGGLGTSLFARLMHAGIKPVLLNRQYRMHPAISDFPSAHFYDGQVSTGIRASDRLAPRGFPWPAPSGPVAFVRVNESGGEAGSGTGARRGQLESRGGMEAAVQGGSFASAALGTSYCNRREAEAVAFALELLLAEGDVQVRIDRPL